MPSQQQGWEDRFNEQFNDNAVWWQECIAEMQIGDPDFKRLKDFIRTELARQKAEIWEEAKKCVPNTKEEKDLYEVRNQSDLWRVVENNRYIGHNQCRNETLQAME